MLTERSPSNFQIILLSLTKWIAIFIKQHVYKFISQKGRKRIIFPTLHQKFYQTFLEIVVSECFCEICGSLLKWYTNTIRHATILIWCTTVSFWVSYRGWYDAVEYDIYSGRAVIAEFFSENEQQFFQKVLEGPPVNEEIRTLRLYWSSRWSWRKTGGEEWLNRTSLLVLFI